MANKLNLKFNPEDWEEITKFLQEWDQWRREKGPMDRPPFTSDTLYLLPLAIALMRAQKQSETLQKILIVLTIILAVLTFVLLFK